MVAFGLHRRAVRGTVLIAGGVALLLVLAGCGVPPGPIEPGGRAPAAGSSASVTTDGSINGTIDDRLPVGSSSMSLTVDGVRRTFRVYRPAGVAEPVPLVVMLHGGLGTGQQAMKDYRWPRQADLGRFVVAFPDGLGRAWNVGGGCCGAPSRAGTDDVAFITAMVADIARRVPIDPRRVYATGISNGGMLAYRLACDTTIFAAIAPDAATLLGKCPDPRPLSVIHVHGLADEDIRYDGDRGDGVAHVNGPPIPALIATWRATDGCLAPVVTVSGPVTTSTAQCPDGRDVELITIRGAGHQWPGAPHRRVREQLLGLDPPSDALDATSVIWQFFAAHPRGTPAGWVPVPSAG